ncbi:MAG: hypothetical protein IJ408_01455 [Clostridia bacterium]|nr:hypothetical protein [Clostridia bacterium]
MLKRNIDMYVCARNDCIDLVSDIFEGSATEMLVVLFLDERSKVKKISVFSGGTENSIVADKMSCIVSLAHEYNSLRLVTIHNHPDRLRERSPEDDILDKALKIQLGWFEISFAAALIY